MAKFRNELLREAIADADAIKETAVANARLYLEESIAPHVRSAIVNQLNEASNPNVGLDPQGFAEVTEGKESVDLKSSGVGASGESGVSGSPDVNSLSDKMGPAPEESDTSGPAASLSSSGIGSDGETSGDEDRGAAKKSAENSEVTLDTLKEAEELEEDDDVEEDVDLTEELNLDAIIRELQQEVDSLRQVSDQQRMGGDMDMGMDDDGLGDEYQDGEPELGMGDDGDEFSGEDEFGDADMGMDAPEDGADLDIDPSLDGEEEEMEEDFDLDGILREIEAELSEEKEVEMAQENQNLKEELSEYRAAVVLLRDKLNEVNILNAKLLYTNKLFRVQNLSEDQKLHVIGQFDRATTLREAKLIYATLAENLVLATTKRVATKNTTTITEGVASSIVGSTRPSKSQQVLNENDNAFKARMQHIAGITKVL